MYVPALLAAGALAGTATASTTSCPKACSLSTNPFKWIPYHSVSRVATCSQPMLLDFALYNPLNDSQTHSTIYACTTEEEDTSTSSVAKRAVVAVNSTSTTSSVNFELGTWGSAVDSADDQLQKALTDLEAYMVSDTDRNFMFAYSGQAVIGLYIGGRYDPSTTAATLAGLMRSSLSSEGSFNQMALQSCGSTANYMVGLAISLDGDLPAVQQLVKTWSEAGCVTGFDSFDSNTDLTATLATVAPLRSNSATLAARDDTCSTVQVVSGDSCTSLVTECGITSTEFYDYNTASDLCSTLAVGQYVCCSSGDLPDYSPQPYSNGTCYTYLVESGNSCSTIAASNSLTVDDIDSFNNHTWGWLGCDDLQAGENICLSSGDPPFPAPVTGATCGPQVPGTTANGTDYDEWATLNPCSLNACCDVWGECGTTPEFCTITESTTGAPGTAEADTNGCISNCGLDIVNNSTAPDEFFAIGYFESFNVERSCLTMDASMIDTSKYTHIIFAFGTINSDYSISINQTDQFEQFLNLTDVKKVVSFGGWDFSTSSDTYTIFREGVTSTNRALLAQNIGDFVSQYGIDGVDFDWEYPGEPDIPGIPAGSDEDGTNYVAFLKEVRSAIGTDKTLSIAMPASYWYLRGFPVADINDIVDFIVYMTYDLHGQWDYGNTSADDGCADGNCLRSHVNLTETTYALSMVTKAGADSNKLMVGVSSYGRSFEMTTANCTGPECTYVGPDSGATPGRCTQTAGYIANAEINEIIATNPTVQVLFDSGSDSDIIVYNETQWVGYMTNTTKSTRTTYYQGLNMGGTTEWAIDLESFITSPTDATAFGEYLVELKAEVYDDETEFIATNQTCSDPSSGDESGLQASEERGVAAYVNWLVEDSLKSPTEWTRKMFMSTGAGATQCDLYPDGECPFPTGFCSDYNVSAEYWAEYVVANAYQYITELGSLFDFATQNETLSIDAIVDDFPVKSGATVPDWATILTNVGGVMGIVGSAIPGLDAEADTTMIGTLSGIFSLAGSDVSSADATDAETTTLEAAVQTVYSGMYQSVKDTLIALFETGDISSWPSDLRTGDYTFEVANFLNGRYMFELTGTQASDIENTFNSYLRQYLVGTALVSANYYILKGAYSTSKCASVSSGTVIGDYCYTLEYPGAGWELVKQIMTDPISSDDLTKLTDTYGVDLETLYSNSYTCQNTTGTYSGVVDIDVLTASSTVPTCFFNLPVFTVETSDEPTINNFLSSPCLVWDRNTTAKTAELGVTWMPSNLADVFVRDFCECNASGRECSEV